MSKLVNNAHKIYSTTLSLLFAAAILNTDLKWSGDEIGIEPNGEPIPHSPEMLAACPSLREGTVKTKIVSHTLNFNTDNWDQHESLSNINTASADEVTSELLFDEDLDDPNPHLVHISSSGGSVQASLQIINSMSIAKKPTYTLCANHISSAAMNVFANGYTRLAMESCTGIAHATYRLQTPLDRLYDHLKMSDHHIRESRTQSHNQDTVRRQILTNNLMDDTCYNFLHSANNGDTYLNSMDFLSLGIADGIILSGNKALIREADEEIIIPKLSPAAEL